MSVPIPTMSRTFLDPTITIPSTRTSRRKFHGPTSRDGMSEGGARLLLSQITVSVDLNKQTSYVILGKGFVQMLETCVY